MNNRKTDRHTPPASSLLGYLAKRYTEKKLHPNENILAHKWNQRGHSLYRLAWHGCIGREGSFLGIRKLHTTLPRKEYHHQEHHHHHDHFYHCLIFDLTTSCTCTVPHKSKLPPQGRRERERCWLGQRGHFSSYSWVPWEGDPSTRGDRFSPYTAISGKVVEKCARVNSERYWR